jgi:hypothetical protein
VIFPVEQGSRTVDKAFDVIVFNQRHNPQTSIGTVLTAIKREGLNLKGLFTQKGLAVIAFLMMLFVFVINSRLCPEDNDYYKKKDE